MKVPLLISGFIVSAFLTLSATSQAAPRGGFRGGSFHGANFRERTQFRIQSEPPFLSSRSCVFFFNSLSGLSTGALTPILTITPIWITGRITISNTRTIRPRLCNRRLPDPLSAVTRLLLSSIQATPGPSIRAPILRYIPSGYISTQVAGQQRIVTQDPNEQIGPQADPRAVIPPAIQPPQTVEKGAQTKPPTQSGPFGNLVLVSWLEDAGKDVIYVQNTETQDVQKITSEPNLDHFRIVELHQNADPKLFEAVISNGSQQGAVRFRF